MISPSESSEAPEEELERGHPSSPVRLVQQELRGRNKVSRLEFHSAGRPVAEAATTVAQGGETLETELRLKEEMAALDVKLQAQAEQVLVQVEAARSEGRVAARLEWEEEFAKGIVEERERVSRICELFGRERAKYFADVEMEVVKLALAVAARIVHREVKFDPMLLAAVVRMALEKVEDNSATVLRVSMEEEARWKEVFVAESSLQVVGDERMAAGECVLETHVGKVELGVSAQLAEIERGFFDLLQQRPA
jgi:flagellar assembly protein FliH